MTSGNDQPPRVDTAALLASVDIVEVIGRHVALKKSGAEFEACCPFHTENTPSFKVSPAKQIYHCFGCGANGDAIAFLQNHAGMTFRQAAKELGADVSDVSRPSASPSEPESSDSKPRRAATPWRPIVPAPPECPEPPRAHQVRGLPERTWCYRDGAGRRLGYVYRFATSGGGKEVLPLTWCARDDTGQASWRWISFPKPRPLYGLDRLASRPEATVMLVEGEPCADVGAEALPELVVITWPGGGKAVDTVDWSPLAERKVVLWPDCDAKRVPLTRAERQSLPSEEAQAQAQAARPLLDEQKQPGIQAMTRAAEHLLALGAKLWMVRLPPPGQVTDGWDIADAVREGMTGDALRDWLRDRSEPVLPPSSDDDAPHPENYAPDGAGAGCEPPARNWRRSLLYTQKGELAVCLANVYDILLHSPEWAGVIGFDEFAARTNKRAPAPYYGGDVGEWTAADDSRTAMWLTRRFRFAPPTAMVAEAIETLSLAYTYHPVRLWLGGLPKWDGDNRLDGWLTRYAGVPDSPYVRLVARWFFVGMVARVMRPGTKFDYCLVLEGTQGRKKSMLSATIGGEWFGDTDLDLQNKDSMSALRGKWVYEFPEMGSVTRVESSRQKSFLSRQYDEFRPVYGRREIKLSRQCVFIGTTNEWEWNKDPTGGRRFWPVEVGEIDIAGLAQARPQLFAEAMHRFEAGEKYWPDAEQQKTLFDPEQLAREQPESLIDALHDWVWCQVSDFSLADAVMSGLKLDASKLTRDLTTRVGVALRKLGCERVERRNGMVRFWYKPPVRNGATSKSEATSGAEAPAAAAQQGAQGPTGGRHVPF